MRCSIFQSVSPCLTKQIRVIVPITSTVEKRRRCPNCACRDSAKREGAAKAAPRVLCDNRALWSAPHAAHRPPVPTDYRLERRPAFDRGFKSLPEDFPVHALLKLARRIDSLTEHRPGSPWAGAGRGADQHGQRVAALRLSNYSLNAFLEIQWYLFG